MLAVNGLFEIQICTYINWLSLFVAVHIYVLVAWACCKTDNCQHYEGAVTVAFGTSSCARIIIFLLLNIFLSIIQLTAKIMCNVLLCIYVPC